MPVSDQFPLLSACVWPRAVPSAKTETVAPGEAVPVTTGTCAGALGSCGVAELTWTWASEATCDELKAATWAEFSCATTAGCMPPSCEGDRLASCCALRAAIWAALI